MAKCLAHRSVHICIAWRKCGINDFSISVCPGLCLFIIDWNSPTPWYPFLTACFPCCLPILAHSQLFALVFNFPLSSDLLLVYNLSVPASLWGLLSLPAPGDGLAAPPGHRCLGPTPPELLLSQSCSCLVSLACDTDGWEQGTPGITAVWFEAQQAPHQPCSEFLSVPDSLVWPCWASCPRAWDRAQQAPVWDGASLGQRTPEDRAAGLRDLTKGAGKHLGKFKVCPLLSTATLEI